MKKKLIKLLDTGQRNEQLFVLSEERLAYCQKRQKVMKKGINTV